MRNAKLAVKMALLKELPNSDLCTLPPEIIASKEIWRTFVEAMKGRQYGVQETRDAWDWFRAGYFAAEADEKRRALREYGS